MTEAKKNRKRGVVDVAEVTDLVIKEERSVNLVQAVDIAGYNTLMQVSTMLSKSTMFQNSGGAAGIFATVLYGHEHGIQPMTALSVIHVINGNFGFSAQFIQAKLERSGVIIDVVDSDENACHLKFSGITGKEDYISEYTIEDAKKAGLVKDRGNYQKNPKDMLYARALTRGSRRYSPAAILGMYDYAEIEVMEPKDKNPSIGTLSASQMGSGDPNTVKEYDDPTDEAVDSETGEIQPTETPKTTDVDPKGTKVDLTDGKEDTGPVDDEPVDKSGLGKRKVYPGTEPETKPEAPVEPEVEPEEPVGPDKDDVIVSVIGLETTKDYGETSRKDLRMSQVGQLELSSLDVGVLVEYENYLTSLPGKEEF